MHDAALVLTGQELSSGTLKKPPERGEVHDKPGGADSQRADARTAIRASPERGWIPMRRQRKDTPKRLRRPLKPDEIAKIITALAMLASGLAALLEALKH